MSIDLIVCAAIQKDYSLLGKSINSVKDVPRKRNYILFDGSPEKVSPERKDFFVKQQEQFKEYYAGLFFLERIEKDQLTGLN